MKNQSGTIKTNLELDRVVMGGSGGYRRLPGGSDHFSLQTNTQTDTHHNIYITTITTIIITITTTFLHNVIKTIIMKYRGQACVGHEDFVPVIGAQKFLASRPLKEGRCSFVVFVNIVGEFQSNSDLFLTSH